MTLENRSYKEKILLYGSLLGLLALVPITVYRFLSGDYLIAALETLLAIGVGSISVYVWHTGKTLVPGFLVSLFSLTTIVVILHVKNPAVAYWLFPISLACYSIVDHRSASVLNLLAVFFAFPAIYPRADLHQVLVFYSAFTIQSFFAYIFTVANLNHNQQLSQLAERDALTGALNRRALDENMLIAINKLKRNHSFNKSLIILDLDHFKDINDTYGHSTGDEILIRIARLIRSNIRLSDSLFRYGGEEFVILVDNANLQEAKTLAEGIRERVEMGNIFEKRSITISLGVAELKHNLSADAWLKSADDALYEAKRSGRNKVCVASNAGTELAVAA